MLGRSTGVVNFAYVARARAHDVIAIVCSSIGRIAQLLHGADDECEQNFLMLAQASENQRLVPAKVSLPMRLIAQGWKVAARVVVREVCNYM
jgi:hypothetical protein